MVHLKIVTPNRSFFDEEVKMVIMRGIEGDLAIMKGTEPLITPLKVGKLRIFKDDSTELVAAISEGYVSSKNDVATIITDEAFWPEEIDTGEVEAARKRAQGRLMSSGEDIDVQQERKALQKAIVKLEVAHTKEKNI